MGAEHHDDVELGRCVIRKLVVPVRPAYWYTGRPGCLPCWVCADWRSLVPAFEGGFEPDNPASWECITCRLGGRWSHG